MVSGSHAPTLTAFVLNVFLPRGGVDADSPDERGASALEKAQGGRGLHVEQGVPSWTCMPNEWMGVRHAGGQCFGDAVVAGKVQGLGGVAVCRIGLGAVVSPWPKLLEQACWQSQLRIPELMFEDLYTSSGQKMLQATRLRCLTLVSSFAARPQCFQNPVIMGNTPQ